MTRVREVFFAPRIRFAFASHAGLCRVKPTPGFEPGTPSLRVKGDTLGDGRGCYRLLRRCSGFTANGASNAERRRAARTGGVFARCSSIVRMFELHEISRAMSMHEHSNGGAYLVLGNKRERMAQYGNAVTPPVMQLLLSRLLPCLDEVSA